MIKVWGLIAVVTVIAVALVVWVFSGNLKGGIIKNKTTSSVDADEPILDAKFLEYISQVKKQLSDDKIENIEEFIATVIEANKADPMTSIQLRKLEADLVIAEMKVQIKSRYDQEIPKPSKSITTGDADEDFGMAVLTYYDESSRLTSDGGIAVRDAIKSAMDGRNVNLLNLSHIQDIYNEKQQATTKNSSSNAASKGVYETLLTYYQEVDLMSESGSILELKKLIKQAVSDDSVSTKEFNQIKTLYLEIKEANALYLEIKEANAVLTLKTIST